MDTFGQLRLVAFQMSFEDGLPNAGVVCTHSASSGWLRTRGVKKERYTKYLSNIFVEQQQIKKA